MIALDLMGHGLRAKVIDRFILNILVILLSLNKCQGAIIESGSPLSIMFQALRIRALTWKQPPIYKGHRLAVSLMQTKAANGIVDLPRLGFWLFIAPLYDKATWLHGGCATKQDQSHIC